MKRLLCVSVLGLSLTQLLSPVFAAEVDIPDSILKSSVWAALGRPKPVGVVTEEDMLKVTEMRPASPYDGFYGVRTLEGLGAAHNLVDLEVASIYAESLTVPPGLSNLTRLRLGGGKVLASLVFPPDLKSLRDLFLGGHHLTNQDFLVGLTHLKTLQLGGNDMTSLTLPPDLTKLTKLGLSDNQLTNLTLPTDLSNLTTLDVEHNPLREITLPRTLAETNLRSVVAELQSRAVVVRFSLQLSAGQMTAGGSFDLLLSGPSGLYQIQMTPDFSAWTDLELVTIPQSGSVQVTDPSAYTRTRGYYRAVLSN